MVDMKINYHRISKIASIVTIDSLASVQHHRRVQIGIGRAILGAQRRGRLCGFVEVCALFFVVWQEAGHRSASGGRSTASPASPPFFVANKAMCFDSPFAGSKELSFKIRTDRRIGHYNKRRWYAPCSSDFARGVIRCVAETSPLTRLTRLTRHIDARECEGMTALR